MTREDSIVARLRLNANAVPVWDGIRPPDDRCRTIDMATGVILFFSRDSGMHTSGWFKNPDYERCWHLSISGFDPVTRERRLVSRSEAARWARLVLGDDVRWAWCEPAASAEGRVLGVIH